MKIGDLDHTECDSQLSHGWCGECILVIDHQLAASLRWCDSRQDLGAHILDALERVSERVLIAVVQLHVVPGRGIRFKPDGLTDHERNPSASVSRMHFVVSARRAEKCSRECASSCVSTWNSTAGARSGNKMILPTEHCPCAGRILVEYSSEHPDCETSDF